MVQAVVLQAVVLQAVVVQAAAKRPQVQVRPGRDKSAITVRPERREKQETRGCKSQEKQIREIWARDKTDEGRM